MPPKGMVKMENPIEMDDLFRKHPYKHTSIFTTSFFHTTRTDSFGQYQENGWCWQSSVIFSVLGKSIRIYSNCIFF